MVAQFQFLDFRFPLTPFLYLFYSIGYIIDVVCSSFLLLLFCCNTFFHPLSSFFMHIFHVHYKRILVIYENTTNTQLFKIPYKSLLRTPTSPQILSTPKLCQKQYQNYQTHIKANTKTFKTITKPIPKPQQLFQNQNFKTSIGFSAYLVYMDFCLFHEFLSCKEMFSR